MFGGRTRFAFRLSNTVQLACVAKTNRMTERSIYLIDTPFMHFLHIKKELTMVHLHLVHYLL